LDPVGHLQIGSMALAGSIHDLHSAKSSSGDHASHTIFVIDHSGSMRTDDVEGQRRIDAVYDCLAERFIVDQLANGATEADKVSVVLMSEGAEVMLQEQSISHSLRRTFQSRRSAARPRGHGNYVPAIDLANRLVRACASARFTTLVFLSDGKPSDKIPPGHGAPMSKLKNLIVSAWRGLVGSLSLTQLEKFGFVAMGFGREDFSILEAMVAEAGRRRNGDPVGQFNQLALQLRSVQTAFSSVSSSLTSSRLQPQGYRGELRQVQLDAAIVSWPCQGGGPGWLTYLEADKLEYNAMSNSFSKVGVATLHVRRTAFGQGSQRNVYQLQAIHPGRDPQQLVGKESKRECDAGTRLDFHKMAAKIQAEAQKLATKFNARLNCAWTVEYVSFCVYKFSAPEGTRYLFAEKYIDGNYVKWIKNDGVILQPNATGTRRNSSLSSGLSSITENDSNPRQMLPSRTAGASLLGSISEGAAGPGVPPTPFGMGQSAMSMQAGLPEAFSHFTWDYTKKLMVLDIQGVLVENPHGGGMFYLTDPAISSVDKSFGATDLGQQAINNFLESHSCTTACNTVKLEAKKCKICLDRPCAVRFTCGHAVCCGPCAQDLLSSVGSCPVCRHRPLQVATRSADVEHESTFLAPNPRAASSGLGHPPAFRSPVASTGHLGRLTIEAMLHEHRQQLPW